MTISGPCLNATTSSVYFILSIISQNTNLSASRNRSSSSGIIFLLLQEAKVVFLGLGGGEDKQLAGISSKIEGGSVGLSFPRDTINVV